MNYLKTLVLFAASLVSSTINSQTRTDIFKNEELPITWLGIDFSQTNYIGDPGTVSASEMKGLLDNICILTVTEADKYNIKKTFRKINVTHNLAYTKESNKLVDADKFISLNSADYEKLDESAIKKVVATYNFSSADKGVGLVFIMDGMNKMNEESSMWVTFINMETKEVIFTERLRGTAAGFGFRNHWAGSVYSVLRSIDSKFYKMWVKRYVPKK